MPRQYGSRKLAVGAVLASVLLAAGIAGVTVAIHGFLGGPKRGRLGNPCGARHVPPARYQHVVWIVMENKSYSDVMGSADAPYVNRLARKCGLAENFHGETHPSLPNYIAMTSGDTQRITDDAGPPSHPVSALSIFSQLGSWGWRALEESMPSNCARSDSDLYAPRHNPAVYFTKIGNACARRDIPLAYPIDLSARFTFVTPNTCHDMHACPTSRDQASQVHTGDTWLSRTVPKILATRQYRAGSTAIFITWDEDSYSADQRIPTLVISPSTRPGTKSRERFDHYSLLRTTEELLGIHTYLGAAASARSLRTPFHL